MQSHGPMVPLKKIETIRQNQRFEEIDLRQKAFTSVWNADNDHFEEINFKKRRENLKKITTVGNKFIPKKRELHVLVGSTGLLWLTLPRSSSL